jgi:hypothetical protein
METRLKVVTDRADHAAVQLGAEPLEPAHRMR